MTQEDNLFGYLTVRETLELSAHFHVPVSATPEASILAFVSGPGESEVPVVPTTSVSTRINNVRVIVDSIIRDLNLGKCENTIIGSASRRGISGGEKKRVAIGKQMMSNPLCLFIDEPTSNLDSFQVNCNIVHSYYVIV